MFKRTLLALVAALGALALMVGGEILLAMRREYLPTEPPFVIEGAFGDLGSPPLRFVVLGDSTAAGLGADTPEDSYPSLLAEHLADEGYRVEMTSLGDVRAGMAEAIELLKATGATVVVSGVPDMSAAAFHEPLRSLAGWRGTSVTAAIADATARQGVTMVPLAAETYRFFAADPEAHNSEDEFHPSSIGYSRWATAIYPYLLNSVGGR